MAMSQFRQITIMWLTTIYLCMSIASAVHSVEHIGENHQAHLDCSLCSHKQQNKTILDTTAVGLLSNTLRYQPFRFLLPINLFQYKTVFQSRAPPKGYYHFYTQHRYMPLKRAQ